MPTQSVLIIAHRGARAFAPENTLEAIEKAARLGADAVEIDVQLVADGDVIVTHDDDLVRCTNAKDRFFDRRPWLVSSFDASAIRSLDAGSWFVNELRRPRQQRQSFLESLTDDEIRTWITDTDMAHYASGNVRVPTLTECLAACSRLHLKLHIELKVIPRFWPEIAERVIKEVEGCEMQREVVISSFDHQQLATIRDLARDIRTAVLTSDRLYRPAEYLARLGAQAYNPGCYGDYDSIGFGSITGCLDHKTIGELRNAGYDVNVWTENDPKRMQALIDAGVTGIFTDYPNRLRALLSRAEPDMDTRRLRDPLLSPHGGTGR